MKQKRGLGAFYAIWQWNKLDLSTAPRAHKDHQITSSLHDVNITAVLLLSDAGRLTNLMWSQWQAKHTMGECQCLTTLSSSSVLLLFIVKYTHFWANKEEWKVRCINTIHCDIHDAGQQTTAYIFSALFFCFSLWNIEIFEQIKRNEKCGVLTQFTDIHDAGQQTTAATIIE